MKISNASKKVLASALSAAMVVAFAPTVAFGAAGDKVDVTIDADGGVATVTSYPYAKEGTAIKLGDAEKNGYKLANWWYDADGDGKVAKSGELYGAGANFTPEKSSVTLKAIYAMPTAEVTTKTYEGALNTTAGNAIDPTASISVDLDGANAKADTNYTLTITNPAGTVVRTVEYKVDPAKKGDVANLSAGAKVYFVNNALTTDDEQVADTKLVSGKYTVELSDGTSTVASESVELVTVKTVNKLEGAADNTKTEKVYWLEDGTAPATLPSLPAGQSWLDADDYAVGTKVNVTKDATFTATDVAQYVADVADYDASDRTINFEVEDSAAADEDSFAVEVKDPSGVVVYEAEIAGKDAKSNQDVRFTFDQKHAVYQHALNGATEKAGTYTITVTKTAKADGKVTSSKNKAVLTEVKYDAGTGSFDSKGALATAAAQDYFVDGLTTVKVAALPAASVVKAPENKVFSKWTLNGKEYDASATNADLKAGQVNTITASYKDVANVNVAAPTVTGASYDAAKKQYTIKVATATAGAALTYSIGGTDKGAVPAAGIVCGATDILKVKASPVAGASDSALTNATEVAIAFDQKSFTDVVKGAKSDLEGYIGLTKVKYLEEASIKAAIDKGQATLDAQVADVEANWEKLVTAQVKGVYDAVAAYANTALAAYENNALVIVGDAVYSIDAKTLAAEQKAIKAITDQVAKDEADKKAVDYAGKIKDIVTALDGDLKKAAKAEDITAVDVAAAKAVNEAIAALPAVTADNAKDVKAAAEKVIADYAALTESQKKLVSSADYAKAVAAVEAADKAIAEAAATVVAQDKAAIAKVKGKTVKAKAKKATKSSLKVVTSKSGAKSTFKKTSGNKKVTVSKSGKIVVKKGLKAGKKYTVKVKATVGASTKTVKVIVKVAK